MRAHGKGRNLVATRLSYCLLIVYCQAILVSHITILEEKSAGECSFSSVRRIYLFIRNKKSINLTSIYFLITFLHVYVR